VHWYESEPVNVTATHSDPPSLSEVRAGVLRRPGLLGEELRIALADGYDAWLRARFAQLREPDAPGVALVAVGGLGRRELAPYSDLDLLLLHDGKVGDLGELADQIWYPIWDSGLGLDHSVRTPDQAFAVARDDLKALLGLIELRHIAGDVALSGPLRERLRDSWRAGAPKRAGGLHELAEGRWQLAGEAAFLLDPNLKDSRGGLRDVQTLHALAIAQLVDFTEPVRAARTTLLDIRGELHRRTERDEDVLRQQEQSGVATALGLPDGDALLRAVNEAARTVSLALDTAWRRVQLAPRSSWTGAARRLLRGSFGPPAAERVPLASGVVSQDGEAVLARDADPWADPALVLRVARAAAEADLPIAPFTLERLATESAPLPQPWPEPALREFVSLLGAGTAAVPVLEALDQSGLLVRLIPEWDLVRFKAQHNPVHRYTVDRHLIETAARAAELTRTVARPDLLLLGALLHDIGKGVSGGDHSVTGAELAERIGPRIGLSYGDAATVTALVRHHLLLPDTATRRDIEDPVTLSTVADAVTGSVELLELLHALTIADAQATGPLVWSDWKAGLIQDLVRRTRVVLGGAQPPPPTPLDEHRRQLAEAGALAVEVTGSEVVVAAPDSLGVLSRAAGVLALHSLDVRSAAIHTHAGMAVNAFVVEPRFGELPDPVLVRNDLARALDGSLALPEKLSAKERAYARPGEHRRTPPSVVWFDGVATDATVLEFRADDSIGLLYRVTAALEQCGVDIRGALVSSLGGAVVDAFYVTTPEGKPIPSPAREVIEARLIGA
jgi:[protein-PII] uridylyltransferase